MKLNLFIVGLVALLIAYQVSANDEYLSVSDLNEQPSEIGGTMTWPMLPGESLDELAVKFYPKNKIMQKQFVFRTLDLNTGLQSELDPGTDFVVPTAIIIPTLKSLSLNARASNLPDRVFRQQLHLSYNIKTLIEKIPQSLINEYEDLVIRNDFLKVELEKLNEKLTFLQNKLVELKLILDKTFTLPQKKVYKNLDVQIVRDKPVNLPVVKPQVTKPDAINTFLDPFNKNFWLATLGVISLIFLVSILLKKYNERKYHNFVNSVTQQQKSTTFGIKGQKINPTKGALSNTNTQQEEDTDRAILEQAKHLMAKGVADEAIKLIKHALQVKPKSSIHIWLYLLEIYRRQNLKDEFEKLAADMHQVFNVMTPLWEEREMEIIVADSLEKFPHLMKKIIAEWPGEPARSYLQSLLHDNRDGERGGFGPLVIEEIMLLISVLDVRDDLWEIKGLIKENSEQIVQIAPAH